MSDNDTKTDWIDPDDAPELTEDWFAQADLYIGDKLVRKGGRPRGSNKEQVTLRIDRDALDRFRADGPGWQSRINSALRKAAGV